MSVLFTSSCQELNESKVNWFKQQCWCCVTYTCKHFTFSHLCTIRTRAWAQRWPRTAGSPGGPPESLSSGFSLLSEDLQRNSRWMEDAVSRPIFSPVHPLFNWLWIISENAHWNNLEAELISSSFLIHITASLNLTGTYVRCKWMAAFHSG